MTPAQAVAGVDQEKSTASTTDAEEGSRARSALRSGYSGSEWLQHQMPTVALSELGVAVADILGEVFRGLYHLDNSSLYHDRTDWTNTRVIIVTTSRELATHDGPELTWLVLLCHAHGVRLAIRGASNRYVRLTFTRGANMYCGTPRTIAQVIAKFAERYPLAAVRASDGGVGT